MILYLEGVSSIEIWFSGGSSNFSFYNISETQVDTRILALDSRKQNTTKR